MSPAPRPIVRHRVTASIVSVAVFALGALHCGGGVGTTGDFVTVPDGSAPGEGGAPPSNLPVPAKHRPTADACPSTRPPGFDSDAGVPDSGIPACASDADCTNGKNGRCLLQGRISLHTCSYDDCFADADCAAGSLCACGTTIDLSGSGGPVTRSANVCLPGNCRVDTDCGAGGFCSPSFDPMCGPYSGVTGYFCHTAADTCTSDDQCSQSSNGGGGGSGTGTGGYCAWQPTIGKWACGTSFCSG